MNTEKFGFILLVSIFSLTINLMAESGDCRLDPDSGEKMYELSKGVTAKMTWNSCDTMFKEIEFDWSSKNGILTTSSQALKKAAELVSEWEKLTENKMCPFTGDVPLVLRQKSKEDIDYKFGTDIPVSDYGFPGWDGVWVKVMSTRQKMQLIVHYWANP